jgi:two-component system chemotaxis response regulator CheB
MDAFPVDLQPEDGERFTALICPSCSGAVVVRAENPSGRLVFRCRVGHVYSVDEVLVGKEEHLETSLWAAVHACEELAALLDDLDHRSESLSDEERHRRMAEVRAHAQIIRDVLADNRAIKLDSPAAE